VLYSCREVTSHICTVASRWIVVKVVTVYCCEEPDSRDEKISVKDVMIVDNQQMIEADNTDVIQPETVSPAGDTRHHTSSVNNSHALLPASLGES